MIGVLAEVAPPGLMPSAIVVEELACLEDILKLVDANQLEQVCRLHSMDPKVVEDRTSGILAKLQTHIEPAGTSHKQPMGHRPPGTAESVAAMVAEGGAQLSRGCAAEVMEIDDDTLTQMAEAAVPQAEEGGGNAEERPAKVAEAKIRLSKVRKISKKC